MATAIKEKELKTDYDELEASDSKFKAGQFKYNLVAQEGSIVLKKEREGM